MFKIPTYERSVVLLLFAFSLVIATSYIVARTIGDSLFLSRIGNEQLSLVFVLSGIFTAIVASIWYLLTKKYSVATTIQASSFAFAVFTLVALALLPKYHHSFWLLASIYLIADIKGCINAINIVSALNTKLGRDASKSAWTAVGLAAPIAAVLAGGALAVESTALSIQTWLIAGMCLDLVAMAIGFGLKKQANIKSMVLTNDSGQTPSSDNPDTSRVEDYRSPLTAKPRLTFVQTSFVGGSAFSSPPKSSCSRSLLSNGSQQSILFSKAEQRVWFSSLESITAPLAWRRSCSSYF